MKSPSKVVKKTVKAWATLDTNYKPMKVGSWFHVTRTRRSAESLLVKEAQKHFVVPATISYQITLPKKGKK